jgi:sarcosine oxidase
LILSTGAYINNLIDSLKIDLKVTRQLLYWIEPNDKTNFQLRNFPCWMIADDEFPGLFYGFPILPKDQPGGNGLLKVAHHTTGVPIVPSELNEFNEEEEKEIIKSVLEKNIPDALGEIKTVSACMYTNTTDENFILDFLPDSKQQIILATGFSGHGFKFVPVIGEIITELVTEGKSKLPIDFLGINRFK